MNTTLDVIEPWAKDNMGRKGVAKFLTKYLDSNEEIKVLNINSPWGGGKTFFLKNWLSEQSKERACVYFNAWESDFSGDPFVSLVAAIREQLSVTISPLSNAENVIRRFTQKASKTLIAATPALTKGVIKKFTGVDIGILSEAVDSDALADAAEKAVEKLIETNKQSLEIVNDFKSVFNELIELSAKTIAADDEVKQVYLFIDELDRCRPTFAIELLERIKHLFDVPGCKFIIATDTTQLSHSIRAVYGAGFASEKYLKRFFDVELTLDSSDLDAWVKANLTWLDDIDLSGLGNTVSTEKLGYFHETKPIKPDSDTIVSGKYELNEHQAVFLALAKSFSSRLRELEKINMQIKAVHANAIASNFQFFWAAYLVFLKDEAPQLYEKAIRGDYHQAIRDITERFKRKNLYFVFSNTSIHDIFATFLILYREGKTDAQLKARKLTGTEDQHIQAAYMAFSRSFDILSRYPTLVDLAYSLE